MKQDRRLLGVVLIVTVIVVLSTLITLLPTSAPTKVTAIADKIDMAAPEAIAEQSVDPRTNPKGHKKSMRADEINERFQQAVAMLHAKQYDYAVKALHRVLELSPRMPEAHVNMGYALIGLQQYQAAADFFNSATEIKPMQVNAYYGLALAYEGLEKYQSAISAMESFIHLADKNDPYINKARAASWEWSEHIRIERSGEPTPRIIGVEIETNDLIDKAFDEEVEEH